MEGSYIMLKKISLALCLVLIVSFTPLDSSFAQESDATFQDSIQPNWTNISEFTNVFSVSECGLSSVESLLFASNVDEIKIVVNLQQYKNGSWTTIKSWTNTFSRISCILDEQWYVISGYLYRMVATGTVYINGSLIEQASYTSPSHYY